MPEKSEQEIPNNTPVFILGSERRKHGVVIGFNGYVYLIEFDDGKVVEKSKEYLVRVPRKRSRK